ncbi:tetratricopeptide repeat protein [bacterium]|nr:tetratricopeptide repeat protein [bacterium]
MKRATAALACGILLIAAPASSGEEKVSILTGHTASRELTSTAEESRKPLIIKEGRVQTRYVVPSRTSVWEKNYQNGVQALSERRFNHAERMLLAAVKSAKGPMTSDKELVESRLSLGELYILQERYPEAYSVFKSTFSRARSAYGEKSLAVARCRLGLAQAELFFKDLNHARENAEEAIDIVRSLKETDSALYGNLLNTLGLIMAEHGWYEDARRFLIPALDVLKKHPGLKGLDLAEAERRQALFYHRVGMKADSIKLYEDSFSLKEKFVNPASTADVVGAVDFPWELGSTRAKEIIDNEFPFRFLSANGVRVAATVIDLWELLGILVTVTNTTDHQRELDLGEVQLVKVDLSNPRKKHLIIPSVDPESIDHVQKELSIWSLTNTRPWLANIQKTRTVRGFVPSKGHDLFRGPNVFGVYGKWKAVSHTVPQKVGLMPSRERVLDRPDQNSQALPGLMLKGNYKAPGVVPVWLEPFESRTGVLFYLNPRDCDVVINVPVGNATFKLPFHTRKKFPH